MNQKKELLKKNSAYESLSKLRTKVYEVERNNLKKTLINDARVSKELRPINQSIIDKLDELLEGVPRKTFNHTTNIVK